MAVFDWFFRSRKTGKITIVQVPNVALAVFAVVSLLHRLLNLSGLLNTTLAVVAIVALLCWAADELVRGVNPWRRVLGGGVLVWQIAALVFR